MDIKQLDKLAKDNAPMPQGIPMHAQCYFISARGLYQQYSMKVINLETAKKEKEAIKKQYELGQAQWELFLKLPEIEDKLRSLKEDPFNTALELEIHDLLQGFLK